MGQGAVATPGGGGTAPGCSEPGWVSRLLWDAPGCALRLDKGREEESMSGASLLTEPCASVMRNRGSLDTLTLEGPLDIIPP